MYNLSWRTKLILLFVGILGVSLIIQVFYIIPYIHNQEIDVDMLQTLSRAVGTNVPVRQLLKINTMLFMIALLITLFLGRQISASQRRAEKELQEREEKFRAISESAIDSIFIKDIHLKYIHVNPSMEKLFGLPASNLIGKTDIELFGEEAGKHIIKMDRQVIKGEVVEEFTTKPVGEIMYSFHTIKVPLRDKEGRVVGLCGIARDITEQKLLREELIQSEKLAAIGKLISGIIHEINNPLTGIIGFSELLVKETKGLNKTQKKELEMISSEAKRIEKIVSNLLSFARKHKSQKEPVIINDVLERVLEIREYELKISNINVKKKLKKPLPNVKANVQQIQQVFLNIINNAEYAMFETHKKGNLTIRTYKKSNMVCIEFINDGKSIPKKDLAQIFDPFFTTKETGKGTGLGLSISYGIIKEHKGNIFAESLKGKETKITVELQII